jgi:kinetochore-associated protein 1
MDGLPILQLAYSVRAHLLICLDAGGRLHLVSPDHMVVVSVWPLEENDRRTTGNDSATTTESGKVTDLTVLEDEGSDQVQLMLITRDTTSTNLYLEIRHLTGFQLVFRVAASPFSYLMKAALSQEIPMLLEGEESSGGGAALTKLRLRGIAEGVPEVRLARMLRRQRFAEAEAFANTFNLDKEELYQARAGWLLSKLSVWHQEQEEDDENKMAAEAKEEQLFAELTATLGQVKNLAYVVECCCLASLSSLAMTRQLLLFARTQLNNSCGGGGEVSQRQLLVLGATLHRLETFMMMNGPAAGGERGKEEAALVQATVFKKS